MPPRRSDRLFQRERSAAGCTGLVTLLSRAAFVLGGRHQARDVKRQERRIEGDL